MISGASITKNSLRYQSLYGYSPLPLAYYVVLLPHNIKKHMPDLKPNSKWKALLAGEFAFEIFFAFTTISYGFVSARKFWKKAPPDYELAIASLVIALLVTAALTVRAFSRKKRALREDNAHALDGVLHTLHAILHERSQNPELISLRVCIFVIGKQSDTVFQLTNYVGDGPAHGAGRIMPIRAGVVGKAFRTGESHYDKLPKDTSVVDYLVDQYGFEKSEAIELRQDRKSWAAVPVGTAGRVVAVIFLDSDSRDFFGNRASPQRQILELATIGVARFVEKM